jgi:uncharacterized membrane protein
MNDRQDGWTDYRAEQIIGNLLRAGVVLATLVVVCGGALYLIRYGAMPADRHLFHGEPIELRTPSGILNGVSQGSSRAMMQLGVLLLVATPVARVAFSVYAFARERDTLYVGITLTVLGLLIFSLGWGYL